MPAIDRRAIYERDRGICGFCGEFVPFTVFEVDHIQPRRDGGGHEPSNLRASHKRCNADAGRIMRRVRKQRRLDAMGPSPFLLMPEVAARLRVDQETVRRWLRQGKMHGTSLGRAGWRITVGELQRFIQERHR